MLWPWPFARLIVSVLFLKIKTMSALQANFPWELTDYGRRKRGHSPFVIIAPHAAGDDLKTGRLARQLARKLNGFIIINNQYFKKSNSRAAQFPERIEDFNKLSWSHTKSRYLWKKKKSEMKVFFKHVAEFCDQAQAFSAEKRAVAIYLHGMNHETVGVDLGVGLRERKKKNRFVGSFQSYQYYGYKCSGVPTLKIKQIKEIRKRLQEKLSVDYNMNASVGVYPAWSKRIAIQFHKHCGRNDYALQLEIHRKFRLGKIGRRYLSALSADTLMTIFT